MKTTEIQITTPPSYLRMEWLMRRPAGERYLVSVSDSQETYWAVVDASCTDDVAGLLGSVAGSYQASAQYTGVPVRCTACLVVDGTMIAHTRFMCEAMDDGDMDG